MVGVGIEVLLQDGVNELEMFAVFLAQGEVVEVLLNEFGRGLSLPLFGLDRGSACH